MSLRSQFDIVMVISFMFPSRTTESNFFLSFMKKPGFFNQCRFILPFQNKRRLIEENK